ncbi:MAG: Phospholipid/glycerol acyltransferase [Myxococcaceae bacterium]|nr:Phospholipid/glycerol acyltransferase [Myxococcaceae bacterium]
MIDWLAALVKLLTGVEGVPHELASEARPQRIYFANHSSHLDSLVLWAALPPALRARVRPAAARDYWGKPGLRACIARRFHAVLIDRARDQPGAHPLRPLEDALATGDSLIMFPEGTRNSEGQVQPFKSGLYRLAQQHPTVELVPVYLANLHRILPKGCLFPVPLTGAAVFGRALTLGPGETKQVFLARAREAVLSLQRT